MGNKYLSEYKGKSFNLQFIRFIAAILVVFHHSFPLSTGEFKQEWLYYLTDGRFDFGKMSVTIFFLFSGYFAAASSLKDRKIFVLIINRYKRLVKPLAVVVIITLISGSFLSNYHYNEYWMDKATWSYLFNLLFILKHELPGVFENNIYTKTINGALWTLPVEFACYIACVIGTKIGLCTQRKIRFTVPIVILVECCIYICSMKIILLREIIRPTLVFFIGVVFYCFREKIVLCRKYLLGMIILFITFAVKGFILYGMVLLFPYICIYICFSQRQVCNGLARLGDFSYEIYLWGFPIQQLVVSINGGRMNPYLNFIISLPIILLLGVLTHNLVEKLDHSNLITKK